MNQECNTSMEDVNDDQRETLQRVPMESLEALLGYKFYHLASAVKHKHQIMLPVAKTGSNYFWRKSRKLNPASGILRETPDISNENNPAPDLASFPASTLDGSRREALSRLLGMSLPVVRIHHHHHAQQIVKQMGADALSVGQDVLLRSPGIINGVSGSALLGHELTHAAQEQARPRERRVTPTEERIREITAITHERMLLGSDRAKQRPVHVSSPVAVPQVSPHVATVSPIRAAAVGRDLGGSMSGNAQSPGAGLDASQIKQIQDGIYRELMLRIREDFERGC